MSVSYLWDIPLKNISDDDMLLTYPKICRRILVILPIIFPSSSHHIQYSHDIPTFFSQHFGGLAHHIVAFFQLEIPR